MKQKELDEILEKHRLWLYGKSGGEQADLYKADLRGANLRKANLYRAHLCGADLRKAILCEANLAAANLYKVDLRGADLSRATLRNASLRKAVLCGVDLRRVDLCGDVDLYKANLCGAMLPFDFFIPMACPDTGSFIAWKKAFSNFGEAYLVKLLIPEDARRSSATGRKCRSDKAKVLAIEPIESVPVTADKVHSKYDPDFYYQVGQCITIPDFDTDRFNECAPGIHFFINRQEAINYCFT